MDPEWADELKGRIDDVESRREAGVTSDEVLARVRKIGSPTN